MLAESAKEKINLIHAQKTIEMAKLFALLKFFQEMEWSKTPRSFASGINYINQLAELYPDLNLGNIFNRAMAGVSGLSPLNIIADIASPLNVKGIENNFRVAVEAISVVEALLQNGHANNLQQAIRLAEELSTGKPLPGIVREGIFSTELTDRHLSFLRSSPAISIFGSVDAVNEVYPQYRLLEMAETYKKEGNPQGAAVVAHQLILSKDTHDNVKKKASELYSSVVKPGAVDIAESIIKLEPQGMQAVFGITSELANPFAWVAFGAVGRGTQTALGATLAGTVVLTITNRVVTLPTKLVAGTSSSALRGFAGQAIQFVVEESAEAGAGAIHPTAELFVMGLTGGADALDEVQLSARNAFRDTTLTVDTNVHFDGRTISDVVLYRGKIDTNALKGIGEVKVEGDTIRFENPKTGKVKIFVRDPDVHFKSKRVDRRFDPESHYRTLEMMHKIDPEHVARPVAMIYDTPTAFNPIGYNMERVHGITIGDYIQQGGVVPADLEDRLKATLESFHEKGLVHGDIHGGNVFLTVPEGAKPDSIDFKLIDPRDELYQDAPDWITSKEFGWFRRADIEWTTKLFTDIESRNRLGTPTQRHIEIIKNAAEPKPPPTFGGDYIPVENIQQALQLEQIAESAKPARADIVVEHGFFGLRKPMQNFDYTRLSQGALDVSRALRLGDDKSSVISLSGSSAQNKIGYAEDIDLVERIHINGDKSRAGKEVAERVQSAVQRVEGKPDMFFVELKTEIVDADGVRKIRWQAGEIQRGTKTLEDGRSITLIEAVKGSSFIKMDAVALIDGRFKMASNVILPSYSDKAGIRTFGNNLCEICLEQEVALAGRQELLEWLVQVSPETREQYLRVMEQQMQIYADKGDFFKFARRLYSKAQAGDDPETMEKVRALLEGEAGAFYEIKSEAEALQALLSVRTAPLSGIAEQLSDLDDRISQLDIGVHEMVKDLIPGITASIESGDIGSARNWLGKLEDALNSVIQSKSREFLEDFGLCCYMSEMQSISDSVGINALGV